MLIDTAVSQKHSLPFNVRYLLRSALIEWVNERVANDTYSYVAYQLDKNISKGRLTLEYETTYENGVFKMELINEGLEQDSK